MCWPKNLCALIRRHLPSLTSYIIIEWYITGLLEKCPCAVKKPVIECSVDQYFKRLVFVEWEVMSSLGIHFFLSIHFLIQWMLFHSSWESYMFKGRTRSQKIKSKLQVPSIPCVVKSWRKPIESIYEVINGCEISLVMGRNFSHVPENHG